MSEETHTLRLQETVKFCLPAAEGSSVSFYSDKLDLRPDLDPNVSIDNTSLNLMSHGGDYLLHISFRRPENAIVFNSREAAGNWGKEERIPLSGVFQHTDVTVTVQLRSDSFAILVDGVLVKTYKKRYNKGVTGAMYGTNSRSVFPDPISVSVSHCS